MKKTKALLLFLAAGLLLGSGLSALQNHPLDLFLLKGSENNVEAYHLRIPLNGRAGSAEPVPLSQAQAKRGIEILRNKDGKELAALSRELGKYGAWIGLPNAEEGWPAVLGGGWRSLGDGEKQDSFDNLQWLDRAYLALRATAPAWPTDSHLERPPSAKTDSPVSLSASAEAPTPVPVVHRGALRVEILNGCGIKGAADWAARRLKGPGIVITGTGNAEHFHFAQTLVKTSAGVPIALEESVERLGVAKESIEESTIPDATVDVVVIVGKDFRALKERVRGRNQH